MSVWQCLVPGQSPPARRLLRLSTVCSGPSGGERSRRSGSAPSTGRLLPPPGRGWPSGRRRGRLASRTTVLARGRSGASWSRTGQFAVMMAANSRSTHSASAYRASGPRHGPGGGGRLGVLVVITAITSQWARWTQALICFTPEPPLISILRGFACSAIGTRRVNTPAS